MVLRIKSEIALYFLNLKQGKALVLQNEGTISKLARTLAVKKGSNQENMYVVKENVVFLTVKPGAQHNVGNMGTIVKTQDAMTTANIDLLVSEIKHICFVFVIGLRHLNDIPLLLCCRTITYEPPLVKSNRLMRSPINYGLSNFT